MLVLLLWINDKLADDIEPSTVWYAAAFEILLDAFVASLVILWLRWLW